MGKDPRQDDLPMVVVFGEEGWEEKQALLDQFRPIYNDAFPIDNEREDFEKEIVPRLKDGVKGFPQTIAVLVTDDGGQVAGGMISDWYPEAKSLEIIYLAVRKDARWQSEATEKKHYGSALLRKGIDEMCTRLGEVAGKKISRDDIYVFFEAENPFHPDNHHCQEQAIGRLRFFSKCGAVRIPINYVQPPLGLELDFARNLFLFLIPSGGRDQKKGIPYRDLIRFIEVFYDGLKDRTCDPDQFARELDILKRQIRDVADEEDLVPYDALSEDAAAPRIHKIAICTHYEMAIESLPDTIREGEQAVCPQWESYETDLFNYAGQTDPPFSTHFAALKENLSLPLPAVYAYTSEGRTYCKLCARQAVAVDVSLSWSVRQTDRGKVRMAHVTLAPHKGDPDNQAEDPDSDFTIQDVIKIIAGLQFGSKQEHYTVTADFATKFDAFFQNDLLKASFGKGVEFRPRGLGCTEVNLDGFVSDPDKDRANRIRCGVLLGIFDFGRMSLVEAAVTLQPIYAYDTLVYYVSRGHLMRIKDRKPKDDERLENLLISPYLLIPSAALLFNEILLESAQAEMAKRMQPGRVAAAKRMLSTGMLSDIFQYRSEKTILSRVMAGRSLFRRQKECLSLCEMRQARTLHVVEALQAMLLAVMALFQLWGFFTWHQPLFWHLLGILLVVFVYYVALRIKE